MFGTGLHAPGSLQLTLGHGRTDRQPRRRAGARRPGHDSLSDGSATRLVSSWLRRPTPAWHSTGCARCWRASWEELYGAAASARPRNRSAVPAAPDRRADTVARPDHARRLGGAHARARPHGPRCAPPWKGWRSPSGRPWTRLGRPDPSSGVRIAGGGSTHPAWRQVLADVLGTARSTPSTSPPHPAAERPCWGGAPWASSTKCPCSGDSPLPCEESVNRSRTACASPRPATSSG